MSFSILNVYKLYSAHILNDYSCVSTNKLSLYVIVYLQLFDMSRNELSMISDHMGHNIDIHTDVYRLQSSVFEKTKVARVLLALESGKLKNMKGKKLDEINVSGK